MTQASILNPQKVPFTGADGKITREWFIFLNSLLGLALGGTVTTVTGATGTDISLSVVDPTSTPAITGTLNNTTVTPGSYTFPAVTFDSKGRATAAANGTPYITVQDASGLPTGPATTLVLPTGTVGLVGTVATYTPSLSNPMTTAGDIIVGGVAGVPTRLAVGANGTVLTIVAGAEAWAAPSTMAVTSQSAAYGFVLADANSMVRHPAADTTARTWTIPANASVAYPIGTYLIIDNEFGAGLITIVITTDTLNLVNVTGGTGTRTLASGGQATAWKVTSTTWRISGIGLS